MKLLTKAQFKALLEANPGQSYAFFEYIPDSFKSGIHITDGDSKNPGFGAWSPSPAGDDFSNPFFSDSYDWNINEYTSDELFAVLEQGDVDVFEYNIAKCEGIEVAMARLNSNS